MCRVPFASSTRPGQRMCRDLSSSPPSAPLMRPSRITERPSWPSSVRWLAQGGVVIRPGLVYGERPGGMFGALKAQAGRGAIIPLLGNGRYAQYLVHEDDLAAAVVAAVSAEKVPQKPVTVAHPECLAATLPHAAAGSIRGQQAAFCFCTVAAGLSGTEAHRGSRAEARLSQ